MKHTNKDFPPEMRAEWYEQLLGLTPYKKGPPPTVGWWKTRGAGLDGRRWWNGLVWSLPVLVGESDEDAEACQNQPSAASDRIEWCGLKAEHFDTAEVTPSMRTMLHDKLTAANLKPRLTPNPRTVLLEH